MTAAIIKEIQLTSFFEDEKHGIETVYFGGGTPGILEVSEIQSILIALQQKFVVSADAEITLEANPDDISPQKLLQWKSIGINRLSVGIQSFNEAELKWMNRAHDVTKALQVLHAIPAAGFTNYSADLIYGSPLQSDNVLKDNIKIMLDHQVPHLSCYALTVEDNTILKRKITANLQPDVDEDVQARQFEILVNALTSAGYEQYEISNFALPGFRSRHNSNYWKGIPYYGLGPSAHSYNGKNERSWNVANNALYIKSIEANNIPAEVELLTTDQSQNETIMIGIRTMEGIDLELFAKRFGEDSMTDLKKRASKFLEAQLINVDEHFLKLLPKGKFLADGIASELFV